MVAFFRCFSTVESDIVERQVRQIVQSWLNLDDFLPLNHTICTLPVQREHLGSPVQARKHDAAGRTVGLRSLPEAGPPNFVARVRAVLRAPVPARDVRARRPRRRSRPARRERGQPGGPAHSHRVRTVGRPVGSRGTGRHHRSANSGRLRGRRAADDTDRVRTAVKKCRAKLGDDAADPTYIFNEHGIGHRVASPGPVVSGGRVRSGARSSSTGTIGTPVGRRPSRRSAPVGSLTRSSSRRPMNSTTSQGWFIFSAAH